MQFKVDDGLEAFVPWTQAVISDMRSLQTLWSPKLDALGDPATCADAWSDFMCEFPLAWKRYTAAITQYYECEWVEQDTDIEMPFAEVEFVSSSISQAEHASSSQAAVSQPCHVCLTCPHKPSFKSAMALQITGGSNMKPNYA